MTTKSPDPSEAASIFASDEVAEQWHRGKAQRDDVNAPANQMMLDLVHLRAGNRVLDVAAGTGDQTLMVRRDASDQRAMYCPRIFLPACRT